MGDIGLNLGTLAALDTSVSVGAGATVSGSSKDLGTATPQSLVEAAQFAITNAGTTDGYDLDILVQFSDDNTTWPDTGFGLPLRNYRSTTAGADLTRSDILTFAPRLRYYRFQYTNNNATDTLSVSSETASHLANAA